MSFDILKTKMDKLMAQTMWKLSQCHDVYRLAQILEDHIKGTNELWLEAEVMVYELEGRG